MLTTRIQPRTKLKIIVAIIISVSLVGCSGFYFFFQKKENSSSNGGNITPEGPLVFDYDSISETVVINSNETKVPVLSTKFMMKPFHYEWLNPNETDVGKFQYRYEKGPMKEPVVWIFILINPAKMGSDHLGRYFLFLDDPSLRTDAFLENDTPQKLMYQKEFNNSIPGYSWGDGFMTVKLNLMKGWMGEGLTPEREQNLTRLPMKDERITFETDHMVQISSEYSHEHPWDGIRSGGHCTRIYTSQGFPEMQNS
jgi:hypothetical protein